MASRASMVHKEIEAGPSLYDPFFDYMDRQVKAARNKMFFSRAVELAMKNQVAMYDIDSLIFRKKYNRFGNLIDEEPIAAFELKYKSPHTVKNGELEVNGFQFMRLRRLARKLDFPLYYFVNIGNKKFILFNVLNVNPQFEWRGERTARDLYAVLKLDDLIVSRSVEDLVTDLKLILEGKEVV